MQNTDETDELYQASETEYEKKDIPYVAPSQTADTLFNFVKERKFLEDAIRSKKLSARYCKENIEYLHLGIKEIAFPMKCFCDINMHKLEEHLSWYGYYGIAFSKKWGMEQGIQPLQYINPESELCKEYGLAFKDALRNNDKEYQKLRDYIALQLMYLKPYSGPFKNRITGRPQNKCFTDECEWRFVADVTALEMEEIITDPIKMAEGVLLLMSNSLNGREEASLSFEYKDIKYIILEDISDYNAFLEFIENLDIENEYKKLLISKLLVWSEAKGDF